MATLGNLVLNITAKTKGLEDGLSKTRGVVTKISGSFDSLEKATRRTEGPLGFFKKTLGGIATVAGGIISAKLLEGLARGITGIGMSSINFAADLEEQLSGIQAVMGLSNEEVGQLKTLISDLGVDPNLKVSAMEAAETVDMLGRNGLTVDEIMSGAAHSTVLLANATGGTFADSANIATDVMALFNIEADDMIKAVDGITSVTTTSKFTIDDYALALAQGGGIAAAAGVDFDDFNTAISAISPLFASGSDAGTSFKTFLQRLVPQTAKAKGAMKDLGLITEDGTNRFFDAQGNLKSFDRIAGILEKSLVGLTEEQKNSALATIFGTDAMRAAVGMANVGQTGFQELQETMGQTDAVEAAAIRMDNFRGALEILEGIFETLKIEIGTQFLPVLKDLTQRLSSFVESHSEGILNFFSGVASVIQTDVVPAFMNFAGRMATALESGGLKGLASEFWAWVTEPGGVIDTAGNVIGSIVTKITGWLETNWPNIQAKLFEWAGKFWNWIDGGSGAVIDNLSPTLTKVINKISDFLVNQWPVIRAKLNEWAGKFWSWIEGDVLPYADAKLDAITAAVSAWVKDSNTQAQLKMLGKDTASALIDGLEDLIKNTDKMTGVGWAIVKKLFTVKIQLADALTDAGATWGSGLVDGFIEWITGHEASNVLMAGIENAIKTALSLVNPALLIYNQLRNLGIDPLGLDSSTTARLPQYASGGVVSGPIGMPQIAVVHGGEKIIPVGGSSSVREGDRNITINFHEAKGIRNPWEAEEAGYQILSALRARGLA